MIHLREEVLLIAFFVAWAWELPGGRLGEPVVCVGATGRDFNGVLMTFPAEEGRGGRGVYRRGAMTRTRVSKLSSAVGYGVGI